MRKSFGTLIFYVVFHDLDLSKVKAEKVAKNKESKRLYLAQFFLLYSDEQLNISYSISFFNLFIYFYLFGCARS